jgi:8-oxo-dGTP pyrophosphatase MutT (NUDIX family)
MSMAQSYKVFIGSSFILFGNEVENGVVFNSRFTNPTDEKLLELIQELELGTGLKVLIEGNTAKNWASFKSQFKTIEAAGGLVQNEVGNWLFIHRNGMWDLPKGKLEKSESIAECAVREVAEECGIEEPTIIRPLSTTYHTYILKGQRVLKPTYWFLMKSTDTSELIPQTEEGISEVKWIPTKEAIEIVKGSFGSIEAVANQVLK